MPKILFFIVLESFLLTTACSSFTTRPTRDPASLDVAQRETLETQYIQSLKQEVATANKDQKEPIFATSDLKLSSNSPEGFVESFSYPHHKLREEFVIRDLINYEIKDLKNIPYFLFDTTNTIKYDLEIKNLAIVNRRHEAKRVKPTDYFNAEIECDGEYRLRADQKLHKKSAGEKTLFKIYGQLKTRGPVVVFKPGPQVKSCLLRWDNPAVSDKKFGVRLLLESAFVITQMSEVRSTYQNCVLPNPGEKLTSMQKFFLTSSYRQLTCPLEVNDIESLSERVDGFNAKVEALLGQRLSEEVIEKQNPYIDLDYSKAPKLDLIIVSYLVYKSDFSGTIISRLLQWHANRGTQVRIYVSDVLQGKKDKAMLNRLTSNNGNIKVREYRFNAKSNHGTIISQLHRVNHIKILSTVSFSNPKLNVSILGGRNIHDGFLFKTPASQASFPELVDYNKTGLAYWRDFEVLIRSPQLTKEIVGQFYTAWDQDQNNSYVRSWTQNILSQGTVSADYFRNSSSSPLVRHYVSTPYSEGRLIEDLYVDMINHARKKILISTPYFRLSKKLAKAFNDAIARGIDITLITRLNLDGDTLGSFLGETNKAGINKFYDKMKVYNYTEDDVILHSKIVLVDDEFSLLGSVNLNRRSFIHDLENALLVYSPSYTQELTKIYNNQYLALSTQITEKQKQVFWKKILIDLFSDKF